MVVTVEGGVRWEWFKRVKVGLSWSRRERKNVEVLEDNGGK